MRRIRVTVSTVAVAATVLTVVSGCSSSSGHVTVQNDGSANAEVSSGNEVFSIPPGNLVEVQYACTDGDVAITFVEGAAVTLPGPVCSDETIVIHDGTAELVES